MAHSQGSTADIDLTRVPGDRRLYALEGVGTLRVHGVLGRSASARSGDRSWSLVRRGFWRRQIEAIDELGAVSGSFEPRGIRRGGTLRFGDRTLTLNPAGNWRERYVLAERGRELALLDGKGWGRRPVRLTVLDPEPLPAGLLLFATFVGAALRRMRGRPAREVRRSSPELWNRGPAELVLLCCCAPPYSHADTVLCE